MEPFMDRQFSIGGMDKTFMLEELRSTAEYIIRGTVRISFHHMHRSNGSLWAIQGPNKNVLVMLHYQNEFEHADKGDISHVISTKQEPKDNIVKDSQTKIVTDLTYQSPEVFATQSIASQVISHEDGAVLEPYNVNTVTESWHYEPRLNSKDNFLEETIFDELPCHLDHESVLISPDTVNCWNNPTSHSDQHLETFGIVPAEEIIKSKQLQQINCGDKTISIKQEIIEDDIEDFQIKTDSDLANNNMCAIVSVNQQFDLPHMSNVSCQLAQGSTMQLVKREPSPLGVTSAVLDTYRLNSNSEIMLDDLTYPECYDCVSTSETILVSHQSTLGHDSLVNPNSKFAPEKNVNGNSICNKDISSRMVLEDSNGYFNDRKLLLNNKEKMDSKGLQLLQENDPHMKLVKSGDETIFDKMKEFKLKNCSVVLERLVISTLKSKYVKTLKQQTYRGRKQTNAGIKQYRFINCFHCGRRFKIPENRKYAKTEKTLYKCPNCDKLTWYKFDSKRIVKCKQQLEHSLRCIECKTILPDLKSFNVHMQENHSQYQKTKKKGVTKLVRDEQINVEKCHHCLLCNKKFSSKSSLDWHKHVHAKDTPHSPYTDTMSSTQPMHDHSYYTSQRNSVNDKLYIQQMSTLSSTSSDSEVASEEDEEIDVVSIPTEKEQMGYKVAFLQFCTMNAQDDKNKKLQRKHQNCFKQQQHKVKRNKGPTVKPTTSEWSQLTLKQAANCKKGYSTKEMQSYSTNSKNMNLGSPTSLCNNIVVGSCISFDDENSDAIVGIKRNITGLSKEEHNDQERQRRHELMLNFRTLKDVVPSLIDIPTASRIQILLESRRYIEQLTDEQLQMHFLKETLRRQQKKLKQLLQVITD